MSNDSHRGVPPRGPHDRVPEKLGRYALGEEIGRGGSSVVHLATDTLTGTRVALKILAYALAESATASARLQAEARTMGRLDHRGIVPVLGSESEGEWHYLVCEYVEGTTLRSLLEHQSAALLPLDDPVAVARFLVEVTEALVHAHAVGVLHRDIKPSNILVGLDGRPRLTDFGLARDRSGDGLTVSGAMVGTLAYMSPEQCLGDADAIDERTDVYALGVVLYEMLTGRRPFEGETAMEIATAVLEREPVAPRSLRPPVPRPLEVICQKAMEKDPAERYESAAALLADLEAFVAGRPIVARPVSAVRLLRRRLGRHRKTLLTAAVLIVVAPLAIAVGLALREDPRKLVKLVSEPAGVEVYVRPIHSLFGDYGSPRRLGRTPLEVRLESGMVRFVFLDDRGASAELSRTIPVPTGRRDRVPFEVSARVLDPDSTTQGMVRVEAGTFVAGFTPAESPVDPVGIREVDLPAFVIDAHEVTIGEFRRFLDSTGRTAPSVWGDARTDSLADRPAAGISFELALAYAEWCGKRLPTWYEFQRAARGTDGRRQPWAEADAPPESVRVWSCIDRRGGHAFSMAIRDLLVFAAIVPPVGSHPKDRSAEGVHDLLGSVSEWVDMPWFSPSPAGALTVSKGMRVISGAAWALDTRMGNMGIVRPIEIQAEVGLDVGFRCVRSLDPLATVTIR